MTYTITENPSFNSLEITFDCKPEQAIRDALKALRFRWHKIKKVWYGYAKREDLEAALGAGAAAAEQDATQIETPAEQPAKKPMPIRDPALMEKYRALLERVWHGDEKMIRYGLGKVAEITELSNGLFFTIEKERIETDFCFGYSDSPYNTEDYDRANNMAHHARTNEDYFFNENMKKYREALEILNTGERHYVRYMPTLHPCYTEYDENRRYCALRFLTVGDVLEALGGSGDLEAIKGTTINSRGYDYYVCTDEDLDRIRAAYDRVLNSHEKKVRAYLKRYGLSKVNSWSYWRDE